MILDIALTSDPLMWMITVLLAVVAFFLTRLIKSIDAATVSINELKIIAAGSTEKIEHISETLTIHHAKLEEHDERIRGIERVR